MQKKIKTLMFLLIFGCTTFIPASEIINIQLRFYRGYKEKKADSTAARSYFLKEGNMQILSETEISAEKKTLLNIYNLKEIKNITNLSIEFYKNTRENQGRAILFKKSNLKINLLKYFKEQNKFRVKIFKEKENEKENRKLLMNTDMVLPPAKAAVIGFSDKEGNIYFLSFHRQENSEIRTKPLDNLPRISQNSIPDYPEKALQAGKEGNVILEGDISRQGDVENIRIWDGDQQFAETAVKAFKSWKFTQYEAGPTEEPIKMILIFVFKINGKSVKNRNHKKILEKIKKTAVWGKIEQTKSRNKQKPWILNIVVIQGKPTKK